MEVALYIASLLFSVVGVVGAIVPVIPSLIFSFISLLFFYFCDVAPLSTLELTLLGGLCALISIIDYFLPAYIVKYFGGSQHSVWGATVGLLLGLAFLPVGAILGPFCGAVLGELMHKRDDVARAFKIGFGSFLAFLMGTALKLFMAVWVFFTIFKALYPKIESL